MANQNTINSKLYNLVTIDGNSVPLQIKNEYIPPPSVDLTQLGGVKSDGVTINIAADGTISVPPATLGVTSLAANITGVQRRGDIRLLSADSSLIITDTGSGAFLFTVAGGSGGLFMASSAWASGTNTKLAYSSPGVINNQGIVLTIETTTGSGQLTEVVVSLNGVNLPNTYTSTGNVGDHQIVIPVADVTNNPIQTAAQVTIVLSGMYNGDQFFNVRSGTLNNTQAGVFGAFLTANYQAQSVAFYAPDTEVDYSYQISGTVTGYNGTINDGVTTFAASQAAGFFDNVRPTGFSVGGSATGNGPNNGPSRTVNFSLNQPALGTYIPAFYAQTTGINANVPPVFTTTSSQTADTASGSTITYPVAAASTSYNWICTQVPLASLMLVTPFGSGVLVPDITAPNQTIAGQVFAVYGWTNLVIGFSSVLAIS